MAKADDGSVVMKTKGKTASTPKVGSGKGVKAPLARSVSGNAKVTKQPGRSAVGRSAYK